MGSSLGNGLGASGSTLGGGGGLKLGQQGTTGILGGKQELSVHVESIGGLPNDHTEVVLYVVELSFLRIPLGCSSVVRDDQLPSC